MKIKTIFGFIKYCSIFSFVFSLTYSVYGNESENSPIFPVVNKNEISYSSELLSIVHEFDKDIVLPKKREKESPLNYCDHSPVVFGDFDGNGFKDFSILVDNNGNAYLLIFNQDQNKEFKVSKIQNTRNNCLVVKKKKRKIKGIWTCKDTIFSSSYFEKNYPNLKFKYVEVKSPDGPIMQWVHRLKTDALYFSGEGGSSEYFVWVGNEYKKICELGD